MNNSITSFNDCKLFHYVVYQFIQPICILLNICVVSTFPNYISMHMCLVAKSCPTFCDPMDCSPQSFFVHEVFQARILEWVTMPSSRGSSWPRDQTHISWISCIAGQFFAIEPPGKPKLDPYLMPYSKANSTLNKLLNVENFKNIQKKI